MILPGVAATAALLVASFSVASPAAAAELIVDNSDTAVQAQGGRWNPTSTASGFHGPDYLFHTAGDGSATVFWPFPAMGTAGRYEVFARWSGGPNRATDATYQITSNAGQASVTMNQKSGGSEWRSLGTFEFQPGKDQGVSLSDKADGVVVADAIRFVGPQGATPPPPTSQPAQQTAATPQAPAGPTPAPTNDARYFSQTRYRVGEDAFWEYFQKRGGVRTFGYPVSNTFTFSGMEVQIFQRQVMQLRPDGGVQTLNLLDEGLMPYTRMNGSTFPAPDAGLKGATPGVGDPDYGSKILEFVRANTPDSFDGEQVNFGKTFFGTVTADIAGTNDPNILGLLNLEIWGAPTSKPARDPTNPGFIYQRFQRGILHYDTGCGCTQGLLLADYFKAILTRRNLPADLAEQARGSKLLGQYAPGQPQSLARPADLPGSSLANAFWRDALITIDAGHGGAEIGAAHTFPDGTVLHEKALNLRVMLRVRDLLQEAGYQVTTTRTKDSQVNADQKDLTGDGKLTVSDELQARVDIANRAGSDILVSIHFNGIADPNHKGTYVFWDPDRPFADRNEALAEMVDAALVKAMKDAGYVAVDHGARKDTSVLRGGHYYLLSPKTHIVGRPSEMPGIIGEGLFLTNDDDANALRKEAIVEAVARGYAEGIKAYFARFPSR
jgi:N-acetylmuramoyl-L-alanine amidase